MDLLQKIGLSVLNWGESVKIFNEKENEEKIVKEGLLNDNESVFLVELKPLSEFTSDNSLRIYYFFNSPAPNFLKLRHAIAKEQKIFLAYEKQGVPIVEYMRSNEVCVEKRLFLYKNAIETVCALINFSENFCEFNQNFFFICEKENLASEKIPMLKIIYHGGLSKHDSTNSENWNSSNYYFWLFYLHFLIFKDYSKYENNSNDLFISAGIYEDDLRILKDLLYEIISKNEATNFSIEAVINFYNKILRTAKLEEINFNSAMNFVNTNPHFMKPNLMQNNIKITPNANLLQQNNLHTSVPGNLHSNLHPNININNNFNNSQINYNQYFQFYNMSQINPNLNFVQPELIFNDFYKSSPFHNIDQNTLLNMYNRMPYPLNFYDFNNLNNLSFYTNPPRNQVSHSIFHNFNDFNPIMPIPNIDNFNFNETFNNSNNFYIKELKDMKEKNEKLVSQSKNLTNLIGLDKNNDTNSANTNNKFKIDEMFNDRNSKPKINKLKNKSPQKSKINNSSNKNSIYNENVLVITDEKNSTSTINIIINKKILPDFKLNTSHKSESGSIYSEEDKENSFLRKKQKKSKKDDDDFSSNKKKLRKENFKSKNNEQYLANNDTPAKILLNYNTLDEKDLEMINKIDNPRRKRVKNINEVTDVNNNRSSYFYSEKSPALKEDLMKYSEIYPDELQTALKDKAHSFMKMNFPMMYSTENFYLYIKLNKERKDNKIGTITNDTFEIKKDVTVEEKPKRLWDSTQKKSDEVDEYLFEIEKQWPIDKFVWCQEAALEFLSVNDYNTEISKKLIKEGSQEFEIFLKDRKLYRDDYKKYLENLMTNENGKSSKRIQLNKLKRFQFQDKIFE